MQSLRNTILDCHLISSSVIILNPNNFDDLTLEYRELYNESLFPPFVLLGISIIPSDNNSVPMNRIKIDYNTNNYTCQAVSNEELFPPFNAAYRCGWCGNVVAENGSLLPSSTRLELIRILEKFGNEITHIKVNGMCCRDKW